MPCVEITEAETGFAPLPGDRNRPTVRTEEIAALNLMGRGAAGADGTVRIIFRSGKEWTVNFTETARAEAVYRRLLEAP